MSAPSHPSASDTGADDLVGRRAAAGSDAATTDDIRGGNAARLLELDA